MPKEFEGKVVVVSGGSRGMAAPSPWLSRAKARSACWLLSNVANLAEGAKAVAAAGGPEPMTVARDLRTLAGCEQVFAQAASDSSAATY